MDNKLIKQMNKARENLILLKQTKKINKEDLIFPEWIEMKDTYKGTEDFSSVEKAIVSIKNSILFQRRVYFCITRDSVREIVKSDRNWKTEFGLKNDSYKSIIKLMSDFGLIKEVKKGTYRTPSVYKVIDQDILSILKIDEEVQLSESIEFSKKFEKKNLETDKNEDTSDRLTDQVGTIKGTQYFSTSGDAVGSSKKDIAVHTGSTVTEVILKKESESLKPIELKASPAKIKLDDIQASNELPRTVNPPIPLTPLLETQPIIETTHQELLNKALTVSSLSDFERQFLSDKQDKLRQFGKFTSKQLEILERIAAKSASPKKQNLLTKDLAKTIIKKFEQHRDINQVLTELKATDYKALPDLNKLVCTYIEFTSSEKNQVCTELSLAVVTPPKKQNNVDDYETLETLRRSNYALKG